MGQICFRFWGYSREREKKHGAYMPLIFIYLFFHFPKLYYRKSNDDKFLEHS